MAPKKELSKATFQNEHFWCFISCSHRNCWHVYKLIRSVFLLYITPGERFLLFHLLCSIPWKILSRIEDSTFVHLAMDIELFLLNLKLRLWPTLSKTNKTVLYLSSSHLRTHSNILFQSLAQHISHVEVSHLCWCNAGGSLYHLLKNRLWILGPGGDSEWL